MPRHRAPSPSRLSITGVLAGTTLGASVLLPGAALGQPAVPAAPGHAGSADRPTPGSDPGGSRDADDDSRHADDDRSGRHRPAAHRHARQHGHARHHDAHPRPLTSGERQYRNGCRQGYILEGCAQFAVPHLLRRGISPLG